MTYEDYILGAPCPCVTEEQFREVHGRIRAENRLYLNKLMMALDGRRKVDAIRALREVADFGLKEAKDYVEALMDKEEPQTLGDILSAATKREFKYCVVREGGKISSLGKTLSDCKDDAEYIVNNYPGERVYACQVISESQEVTVSKMVDL